MPTYRNSTGAVVRYRSQTWNPGETFAVMFYVPSYYGLLMTADAPVPPIVVYSEKRTLSAGTTYEYPLDVSVAPVINNAERRFRVSVVTWEGDGYLHKNRIATTGIYMHEKLMYRCTDEESVLEKIVIEASAAIDLTYTINIERADYLKW